MDVELTFPKYNTELKLNVSDLTLEQLEQALDILKAILHEISTGGEHIYSSENGEYVLFKETFDFFPNFSITHEPWNMDASDERYSYSCNSIFYELDQSEGHGKFLLAKEVIQVLRSSAIDGVTLGEAFDRKARHEKDEGL